MIVSNTTVSRPDSLQSFRKSEPGGLSGEPLKALATDTVKDMYRLTNGKLCLHMTFAVGRILNAHKEL